MALLLGQGRNHVPQGGEALVDGLGLLEAVPRGLGAGDALGAGEVDEVEAALLGGSGRGGGKGREGGEEEKRGP